MSPAHLKTVGEISGSIIHDLLEDLNFWLCDSHISFICCIVAALERTSRGGGIFPAL